MIPEVKVKRGVPWTEYVAPTPDGCLLWRGSTNRAGYARRGDLGFVHRYVYETEVGPIPNGLCLDHLCHTTDPFCPGGPSCRHRRCVNPEHLEPVTQRENTLRSLNFVAANAAKTHCLKGHPFTPENTYLRMRGGVLHRVCRICGRAATRAFYARQASISAAVAAGGAVTPPAALTGTGTSPARRQVHEQHHPQDSRGGSARPGRIRVLDR